MRDVSTPSQIHLITVAREFGSGGSDLAGAVGRRLGWTVLHDREVVRRVAARLGAPERDVEASDEHVATLAERLGASLAGAFPEVVLPPSAPSVDVDRVADAAVTVLLEAAVEPDVIVVGHGGMCLFADRGDSLHVRVVASLEHRVAEVVRRLEMSDEAAREEIHARDVDRRGYIRRRYGPEWDDPTLYHLVINIERVGPDSAAAMVATLVERSRSPR
ncbi:MAG: cytidylate kinase-like family protein [Gemmatimonadota bacterium]|jgi:cytidylate kinase